LLEFSLSEYLTDATLSRVTWIPHFPTHGNWTGLSLGWVSTIWLSSMLSRGDHRMVHVEPWVAKRLWTLGVTTGQAVTRVDCTDDRLEIVLRRLSEDTRWAAFEAALNQYTVRVYDLSTARVHVDSTSASVYATVSEGGLFQLGHSKDHRPDLPQVKVMQAVLDPLGMPLATDVVSGERADDPLYITNGISISQTNKYNSTCWPYCHGHALPPSWLKACNPARNGGAHDHSRFYHGVVL